MPQTPTGERLRETQRRERQIEVGVRHEDDQVLAAEVARQRPGRGRPIRVGDQAVGEREDRGIDQNGRGHHGIAQTTAVQLWKPLNCPSARAICP